MSLLVEKRTELLRYLAKHGETTVAELADSLVCSTWYIRLVVSRTPTEVRFKSGPEKGLAPHLPGLLSDAVVEFGPAAKSPAKSGWR